MPFQHPQLPADLKALLKADPVTEAVSGVLRTLDRGTTPRKLVSSVSFSVPEVPPVQRHPDAMEKPVLGRMRPIGKIRNLSEARRIDLMLIPAMLWRLFSYGASDHQHEEADTFRNLLADAMTEPVNGEGLARAEKLGNRVQREAKAIMDEHFHNQPNARVGIIIFFTVQQMLEEGTLELVEGSAMADALFQLHDMCIWFVEKDPRVERSCRKAARKFADVLKRKGYFR